jgi:hypothetical protein
MRVEVSGKAVGAQGQTLMLWYCRACDRGEHELRPA